MRRWIYGFTWSVALSLLSVQLVAKPRSSFDGIGRRALPRATEERELRAALSRVHRGLTGDLDLLKIRVALVEQARGKGTEDPGNRILLTQFRFELDPEGVASNPQKWLSPAFESALISPAASPDLRARGELLRAQIRRAHRQRSVVEEEGRVARLLELQRLDRAAREVVEEELRAQLLLLRGFVYWELLEAEAALESWRELELRSSNVRLRGVAQLGISLAELSRNQLENARLAAKAGASWLGSLSPGSTRSPWADLFLSREDSMRLELVLELGRAHGAEDSVQLEVFDRHASRVCQLEEESRRESPSQLRGDTLRESLFDWARSMCERALSIREQD